VARRRERDPEAAVTVNVSPHQLQDPGVAGVVAHALEDAGVPPRALVLEVTERVLLEDRPAHRRTLAALDELGVLLALDDFGVGYSALSYLRRFPLDILKVDRSFTEGIEDDRRAERLVRAIIQMGGALGLQVIAEGIETPRQAALLRGAGCKLGQGYHFGRPEAAGGRFSRAPASAAARAARPRPAA
jgi:EAL domain-containing protein (putative c-di-GMP-specific phosphodiesterase class I)